MVRIVDLLHEVRDFEESLEVVGAVLRPSREQIAERVLCEHGRVQWRLGQDDAERGQVLGQRGQRPEQDSQD